MRLAGLQCWSHEAYMAAKPISDSVMTRRPFLCRVLKSSETITLMSKLQKPFLQRLCKGSPVFVPTFEQCSSQKLPTRWWRKTAELGSCLTLHRSHSSADSPGARGAESPPPAADSCHLRNPRLHSDASAANNTEQQQLENHDCLSLQLTSSNVNMIAG